MSLENFTLYFLHEILEALRDVNDHSTCININHFTCTENETITKLKLREVKAAWNAREVMKTICYPSDTGLIAAITKRQIIIVPIFVKDLLRATMIYGKDVA